MSRAWASDLGRALTRSTPAFTGTTDDALLLENAALTDRFTTVDFAIRGVAENGPHVLIDDPALREFVEAHVGDALEWVAKVAGLDEARGVARALRGDGPVPTALGGAS